MTPLYRHLTDRSTNPRFAGRVTSAVEEALG